MHMEKAGLQSFPSIYMSDFMDMHEMRDMKWTIYICDRRNAI